MASFFLISKDLPPVPELDFGLWVRTPSAGFPHPAPAIHFSLLVSGFPTLRPRSIFHYWSAVSHSKSRDFRFRSHDFRLSPPALWSAVSVAMTISSPIRGLKLSTNQKPPSGPSEPPYYSHRIEVTYDRERKSRNCVTHITLSCLCFMLEMHHFIFEGVTGQMRKEFPEKLLQNK